ncbi:MAG: methyltransferase domain-containing protein, partial [Syntrophobacterales bacterium]
MRYDLQLIASWIEPGSRVLDLGCGEGDLLRHLIARKGVTGTGIEHNEEKVARCIEKGLSVLQGDISQEVLDYPDNAFDYVILSQTLQQVYEPAALIRSMLRIGHKGIVSFPNFGHWGIRRQAILTGYAPVSRQLPYQW